MYRSRSLGTERHSTHGTYAHAPSLLYCAGKKKKLILKASLRPHIFTPSTIACMASAEICDLGGRDARDSTDRIWAESRVDPKMADDPRETASIGCIWTPSIGCIWTPSRLYMHLDSI